MTSKRLPTALPTLVAASCAVMMALVWLLTLHEIRTDRQNTIDGVQRADQNLARAFDEHVARTLAGIDQAVLFVKDQYERHGDGLDLPDLLQKGVIDSRIFTGVFVIGADGWLRLANRKPFVSMSLADREHFRVHVERDTGQLFVSKPVLGRSSGKWSIQLTRRINRPDGSFGGVVVVSVDPFYFTSFYGDVDLGRHGVVSLVGTDGVVRARRTADRADVGVDVRSGQLMAHVLGAPQGHYENVSHIDGVERLYTYRTLRDWPLVVMLGVSKREALAGHLERRDALVTNALLASTVIVLLAAALYVAASRLQRARARAEEANRMKSSFLANMSHELRTPLNGILGFAQLIEQREADPQLKRAAGVIRASGQHLLELVNSILDLAKIEAGRMEVAREPVPIREAVAEVAELQRLAAQAKGLALCVAIGDDVPAHVQGDRVRIVQVLNNLVDNAVKFTDAGSVTIEARHDGESVTICVRDTGRGIPPEAHAAVFDRFHQIEGFDTRSQRGTGLGLALVRELVGLMGGRTWLESALGRGSSFFFTLPAQPATHAEAS